MAQKRWLGLTWKEWLIIAVTITAIVLLILAGIREQQDKVDRAAAADAAAAAQKTGK